jgi:hypothetical protein
MRCEFCGANLMGGAAAAVPSGRGGRQKLAYSTAGDDESTLSTGEILLCIFCSGIACIMGIVFLTQGKPKGWKMIAISFGVSMIGGIIRGAIELSAAKHGIGGGVGP